MMAKVDETPISVFATLLRIHSPVKSIPVTEVLIVESEYLGKSSNHENTQITQPTKNPIATTMPWRLPMELLIFAI